ncbi:unnamed protein product [Ambrosiozyma monospora]|uniref:Unnamed protein product n=1 Tax=Ambrosiozyma monospora TaxID=43982 RepID=A0ACB5T510_AMBMO|nr:unnamed protein product [Ambrosiozyma monospora]
MNGIELRPLNIINQQQSLQPQASPKQQQQQQQLAEKQSTIKLSQVINPNVAFLRSQHHQQQLIQAGRRYHAQEIPPPEKKKDKGGEGKAETKVVYEKAHFFIDSRYKIVSMMGKGSYES